MAAGEERRGCKTITSQVRRDNAPSLALHRVLGFRVTGAGINRRGHPVVLLEKALMEE